MNDTVIASWIILIWILVLNCCAAGVGEMLHLCRKNIRRAGRVVVAAAVAALMNIGMFVPIAFTDPMAGGSDDYLIVGGIFPAVLAITFFITLPGAIVITRKLEAPGDEFRAFE